MQASLSEQLLFCTTQLVGKTACGTGFFFSYKGRVFLITNKHVIKEMPNGSFSLLKSNNHTVDKEPILGAKVDIPFCKSNFIGHPDPNIDVIAMNISEAIENSAHAGNPVFTMGISEDFIPKTDDYNQFIGPIEEVVFVGYPSGLYDSKNILPIVRRGITASPCYIDFGGEKKFLIDASVFQGSSGSPVFIFYHGIHPDKQGNAHAGDKLYFLGIISHTYSRTELGELKIIDIPTSQTLGTEFKQMIDIGIVFKSETIIETMDHYLKVANYCSATMQGGHAVTTLP